jgi:Ca-activated chloride channel family protein
MRAAAAILLTFAAVTTCLAQQTFRAGIDLVHFSVVVTDKDGVPLKGLKASDFELREEGTQQSIAYFEEGFSDAGGDMGSVLPLHLGLALDTSASMEPDMSDVRTAAIKFLNANSRAVDTTYVDFDTEVRISKYTESDYLRLIERIRMRQPQGFTALYDALGMYLNDASAQTGEKILLVYTDGGDTRSSLNLRELGDLLKASDVTIYVIGYLAHMPDFYAAEQRQQLQRIAELTGGQAFFPATIKDLDKAYAAIQYTIGARYSLGYMSTDTKMDGTWRRVQIRLKRPDLKNVKIRTREGYFAPYKEAAAR